MTDDMMNLRSFAEKSADADGLREMIAFAAEKLMALEVGAKTKRGLRREERVPACPAYQLSRPRLGDTSGDRRASHSEASHRVLFPKLPRAAPHGRRRL